MVGYRWVGVVAALLSLSAHAQPSPASQTAEEVRAVLRTWDWEGDWFQDCRHQDRGGHFNASLAGSGYPTITTFRDGKQTGEGQLTDASITSDGRLRAVTETRFRNYVVSRFTTVQISQDNSFWLLSAEVDADAIAEVPPNLFAPKPEGMPQGTHLHARMVSDSMILDSTEQPLKPVTVYHRCTDLLG